jgi:hypothetical protein
VSARELSQLVRFFLGQGTVDGREILTAASVARIERGESNLGSGSGFAELAYGLGNVPFPDEGATFRGHNGGIDSFTSVFGYSRARQAGYVLLANGGKGVDIARPASRLVQEYLARGKPFVPEAASTVEAARLRDWTGLYRVITPSNTLTRPYQEILGLSRVAASAGRLVVGGKDYWPAGTGLFRRSDREAPTFAFVEKDGATYRLSAFNAAVKEPAWRAAAIVAVLASLAVGAVLGLFASAIWLVAWARGRLSSRGGPGVRFLPVLALLALGVTFGLPLSYLGSGAIPEALRLARPGPYSYAIFAASLLFPVLALLGFWAALTRREAGLLVRAWAALTCGALLAFSAYAASIGWAGARTWTM